MNTGRLWSCNIHIDMDSPISGRPIQRIGRARAPTHLLMLSLNCQQISNACQKSILLINRNSTVRISHANIIMMGIGELVVSPVC